MSRNLILINLLILSNLPYFFVVEILQLDKMKSLISDTFDFLYVDSLYKDLSLVAFVRASTSPCLHLPYSLYSGTLLHATPLTSSLAALIFSLLGISYYPLYVLSVLLAQLVETLSALSKH